MLSIQHHSEWAVAERLVAANAQDGTDTALHVALAERHEQSVADGVNTCLAPFDPGFTDAARRIELGCTYADRDGDQRVNAYLRQLV